MSADNQKPEMSAKQDDTVVQIHIPEDQGSQADYLLKCLDEEPENNTGISVKEQGVNNEGVASVVAQHYNMLEEKGLAERKQSRIFHMRNMNNWIKSRLIGDALDKIRRESGYSRDVKVLDLGCGKGGDLLKWERGRVSHVICADIASTSIDQCKQRYQTMNKRIRGVVQPPFSAEFIAADCTRVDLQTQYKDKGIKLDLVSCQFAFHYCFESLQQAEQMLANVSSNLQPGGFFIGTTIDANDIMRRLNRDVQSENRKFGNAVFSVEFPSEVPLDPPPLFGAKYNFHLTEVVDCPEFLVHFPTFEKLALRYGLKLVEKNRFEDFFEQHKESGRDLLMRMKALETYPPYGDREKVSSNASDYAHAEEYLQKHGDARNRYRRVGTLSKDEWEAVSLYLAFVFQKVPSAAEEEGSSSHRKRRHSSEEDTNASSVQLKQSRT